MVVIGEITHRSLGGSAVGVKGCGRLPRVFRRRFWRKLNRKEGGQGVGVKRGEALQGSLVTSVETHPLPILCPTSATSEGLRITSSEACTATAPAGC